MKGSFRSKKSVDGLMRKGSSGIPIVKADFKRCCHEDFSYLQNQFNSEAIRNAAAAFK